MGKDECASSSRAHFDPFTALLRPAAVTGIIVHIFLITLPCETESSFSFSSVRHEIEPLLTITSTLIIRCLQPRRNEFKIVVYDKV